MPKSFEWSHYGILSGSKSTTTLYNILNSTKGNYSQVAFSLTGKVEIEQSLFWCGVHTKRFRALSITKKFRLGCYSVWNKWNFENLRQSCFPVGNCPVKKHVLFTSFNKESPVQGYSRRYLWHHLEVWWWEHKRMELVSNGTRSSLDGPFHASFRKFLVNGKRPQSSTKVQWKRKLFYYHFISRLRLFIEALSLISDSSGCFWISTPLLPQASPHVFFIQQWIHLGKRIHGLLMNENVID